MSMFFRSNLVPRGLFRGMATGLLVAGFLVTTHPAAAQHTNTTADTTLEAKDLGELIQALEKKFTGYHFLYDIDKLRSRTSLPKLDIRNNTLQQSLQTLNKAGLITYRIDNNAVSISLLPLRKRSGTGMLTGKVSDKQNEDPVSGATIRIGQLTVATDADGIFSIELPKGNYIPEISSVGYGSKKLPEVEIKEHETLSMEITLTREKGQLQSVVVKASSGLGSVNALYMHQKNHAAITDGISAEQIKRSADRDASQVLRRVAGVSV
ncbi:MAG: carboxypeptidase-like regulatory domain-containing protein, partial [Chitinophagaceae bacterium]|nr:carboxypeptidase-like regulatory domain-containing protein [Chitinophagaceae bacterium]